MLIALDYDNTYSLDHAFWDNFVKEAKAANNEVIICTMRPTTHLISHPIDTTQVRVYYTGGLAKKPFLKECGVTPSVWIDDRPECIVMDEKVADYVDAMKEFESIARQSNLPWLLVCCELLKRKYGNRKLVFLGRDCQLLQAVYSGLYSTNCGYLPFSRRVAVGQPEASIEYLKSQVGDGVLIDISSTGRTWELLKHPFEVCVLIYSDQFHYTAVKPVPPRTFSWISQNSVIGQTNEMVEVFNCGNNGSITRLEKVGDDWQGSFAPHEYTPEFVSIVHKAVLNSYTNKPFGLDATDEELMVMFKQYLMEMCARKDLLAKVPSA